MDIFNYIPLIAAIIAVLACSYASYSDMKRGIIPNKLTLPLIGLGLVLNLIYSVLVGNLLLIVSAAIITVVIFALGYLFWKMGAWAGGDVKLFTSLAALLAVYPPVINYNLLNNLMPVYATYPFPFTLIINSILSMLPFLLIYVIYIGFRYKPNVLKELAAPVKDYRKNIVIALSVSSAVYLAVLISFYLSVHSILIYIILIFILSMVISRLPRLIKAVFVSIILILALIQNLQVTVYGIVAVFVMVTVINIVKKLLTTANKEALQDDYKVDQLKEGMIPAYNLYQNGDEVYYDDKSFYQKMKEAVKTADLSPIGAPRGKLLVSTMAAGLKDEDIKLLKDLSQEHDSLNTFKVKKGVPFAPSILIGLLISLFIGDIAIIFVKVLSWLMYGI